MSPQGPPPIPEEAESNNDAYFDNIEDLWEEIEDERKRLKRDQLALMALDAHVSKVDRDIGAGNIDIDKESETVTVKLTIPDLRNEAETIIHGYEWSKQMTVDYDTRSRCLQWKLQTDLETLAGQFRNGDCQ